MGGGVGRESRGEEESTLAFFCFCNEARSEATRQGAKRRVKEVIRKKYNANRRRDDSPPTHLLFLGLVAVFAVSVHPDVAHVGHLRKRRAALVDEITCLLLRCRTMPHDASKSKTQSIPNTRLKHAWKILGQLVLTLSLSKVAA